METTLFVGKGGVGKSLSASAFGVALADQGYNTLLIDYDSGHSIPHTMGIEALPRPNEISAMLPNLSVAVIESVGYTNILESKEVGLSLDRYLEQFPGVLGVIPFMDMLYQFFGVPIDIAALQKFMILTGMLQCAADRGFTHVIVDVEPTAGLQRLLEKADASLRSLRNLRSKGRLLLLAMSMVGAKWSDIAAYLSGPYLQNMSEHLREIEFAVQTIKSARFSLVCTPESGPVAQATFVREIVEEFGGTIYGYVINNYRGEEYEQQHIAHVKAHGLPVKIIPHHRELHLGQERIPLLLKIGRIIME